jgi:hypothetical protein
MHYDANRQPDPKAWLDLDEQDRVDSIIAYHHRKRVQLENAKVHAVAHLAVENQIALGEPPLVSATFVRLMDEGLNRHDAIHAVGSVLMGVMFETMRGSNRGSTRDFNAQYNRELAALKAARWRAQSDEPSET